MNKATFIRRCAHNLHEREQVQQAMQPEGKRKISKARLVYLRNQMGSLEREKKFLLGIKHEFSITSKDCFRI